MGPLSVFLTVTVKVATQLFPRATISPIIE